MHFSSSGRLIKVPKPLVAAVVSSDRVREAPHSFYRYPGRFSPLFAREAINAFSLPGDTVLDPFCGGGTCVVEAVALGRNSAGFDINSLATFLAKTKTTPLSKRDRAEILDWLDCAHLWPRPSQGPPIGYELDSKYYLRNLPLTARLFIKDLLAAIELLSSAKQNAFVRMVLLGVAQGGLDCRTSIPRKSALKKEFSIKLRVALDEFDSFLGNASFAASTQRSRLHTRRRIFQGSAEDSVIHQRIPSSWLPAKLVVTSPPYPGVHVVYHRWQVLGRRETPAPYWIANQRDGAGESHYLLGPRSEPQLTTYYKRLHSVFSNIRPLLADDALVVQLVAFSDPSWQVEKYLYVMKQSGYRELKVHGNTISTLDGRIWRRVPGRKWYANNRGAIAASNEVMLIHTPS
jgi:DNA modification methylase